MTPRVDVVVVNWGTASRAVGCATAFRASRGVEVAITVVDNPSTPADRATLREELGRLDGVRLVELEANLGFGTAANRGLADGTAELVCVSNADVAPSPDALAALVAACASSDVALAAPRFREEADGYHADLPSPASLVVRPVVGGFGQRWRPVAADATQDVEQPAGACLVARREVWEQLGGFDESFFLWYEDVDLARRALATGRRNVVVGSAVVDHVAGDSARSVDPATAQAIRLRSLRRYVELHHPRWLRAVDPVLVVAAFLRLGGGPVAARRRRELLRGPAARRWRRTIRPGEAG